MTTNTGKRGYEALNISPRSLTRKEIKALKADGFFVKATHQEDDPVATDRRNDEFIDRILKMVLTPEQFDALEDMPWQAGTYFYADVMAATFPPVEQEEKNLSSSGPGTPTETGSNIAINAED
jgi:hypothetical protein